MNYQVEINRRFTAAFRNINPGVYIPYPKAPEFKKKDYKGSEVEVHPPKKSYGVSPLGTPYFDAIQLKALNTQGSTYTFPNDPKVEVSYQKKSVVTPILGGSSVIETAGIKEADIRIKGVLWDNEGDFPEGQLSDFMVMFREGVSLRVEHSRLLLYYGIDHLFIESVSLPALEGFPDTQPFIIKAREVKPVKLDLFEA